MKRRSSALGKGGVGVGYSHRQRLRRKVWRMEIQRRLSASGKTGEMLFPLNRVSLS